MNFRKKVFIACFDGFFMSNFTDKIIVSIMEDSLNKMKEKMDKAISIGVRAIEARCDGMYEFKSPGVHSPPLKGLMRHLVSKGQTDITQVITFRSSAQAGGFGGFSLPGAYLESAPQVEQHRKGYISHALNFAKELRGHFIIDFEDNEVNSIPLVELPVKTLVSYHNNLETPENLLDIYARLKNSKANIIKIVTRAKDYDDSLEMLSLVQEHRESKNPRELIAFCTGQYGSITRVLSPLVGAAYTFACLGRARTAQGQLDFATTVSAMNAARGLSLDNPRKMDVDALSNAASKLNVHVSQLEEKN